ncbi:predicted protein [Streptomyces sp. AA4]|nr:predicted protein [Streptomyces sp. AA4]
METRHVRGAQPHRPPFAARALAVGKLSSAAVGTHPGEALRALGVTALGTAITASGSAHRQPAVRRHRLATLLRLRAPAGAPIRVAG